MIRSFNISLHAYEFKYTKLNSYRRDLNAESTSERKENMKIVYD